MKFSDNFEKYNICCDIGNEISVSKKQFGNMNFLAPIQDKWQKILFTNKLYKYLT